MTEELFKRILIATDGSENNYAAIYEAIRIAKISRSMVYAVYVIDSSTYSSVSADVPLGNTYQVYQAEAEKAFSRIISLAGNLNVETNILEGRPAAEVVKFAQTNNCDLIVIGTQGKSGLVRLILGSVAEDIIRSAQCKVLVVK